MKLLKIFAFGGLAVLVGAGSAFAEGPYGNACALIESLGGVFRTLRTLCFAGAAFVLMAWGWEFIKSGWGGAGTTDIDGLKKKGIGMLVGFVLLFGVGILLQFLPGYFDCGAEFATFNN